jgi:hypothetical protein
MFETLASRNDLRNTICALREVSNGGQEPAIPEVALVDIKARNAVHDELGVASHFLLRISN